MPVSIAQGVDPNFDKELFNKYMGNLRDPDGNKPSRALLDYLATGNPTQALVPFRINDRNRFLQNIPNGLYPESPEYRRAFSTLARDSIEGKWVYDPPNGDTSGDLFPAWRWIPGALNYYVNGILIPDEGEGNTEITITPSLRDFEWLVGYEMVIISGFSGWKDDDQYSASLLLLRLEEVGYDKSLLDAEDRAMLISREGNLRSKDGSWKKYIPADEMLYMTHEHPKGLPLFQNEAEDEVMIGTRGIGKSFSVLGQGPIYDFTFNGARTIDDYINKTTTRSTVMGSWGEGRLKDFASKFTKMYNKQRTGVGSYFADGESWGGPFWQDYAGSTTPGGSITKYIRAKGGGGGKVGVDNNIYFGNLSSDPSLGAGKRADMYADECGLANNFDLVKGETKATASRKTKSFKTMYMGTGGVFKKVQQLAETYKNPHSSKIRAHKDRFSRRPGRDIGMFLSCVFRSDLYRDDQGFIKTTEAYVSEVQKRLAQVKSPQALIQHIASYPFEYKEIFAGASNGKYDTAAIDKRLEELEHLTGGKKKTYYLKHSSSSKLETPVLVKPPQDAPKPPTGVPGESTAADKSKIPGVLFRYPQNTNGAVKEAMKPWPPEKVVFYDPVNYDDGGPSDAMIVAWQFANLLDPEDLYQGPLYERQFRCDDVEEIHEEVFKVGALYNAPIWYENNVRDFYKYALRTKRLNQLLPTLKLITGESHKRVLKAEDYGHYLAPAHAKYHERDLKSYLSKKLDPDDPSSPTIYEVCESESMLNHLLYDEDGVNNDYASVAKLVAQFERAIFGDLARSAGDRANQNTISDERLRKIQESNKRHQALISGHRVNSHYRETYRKVNSRRR